MLFIFLIIIWQRLLAVDTSSSSCNGGALLESPPSSGLLQSLLFSALLSLYLIIVNNICFRVRIMFFIDSYSRMSELIQERQKYPWYWFDGLYSVLPSGKEHARCLKVLHDATSSVSYLPNLQFVIERGMVQIESSEPLALFTR